MNGWQFMIVKIVWTILICLIIFGIVSCLSPEIKDSTIKGLDLTLPELEELINVQAGLNNDFSFKDLFDSNRENSDDIKIIKKESSIVSSIEGGGLWITIVACVLIAVMGIVVLKRGFTLEKSNQIIDAFSSAVKYSIDDLSRKTIKNTMKTRLGDAALKQFDERLKNKGLEA